MLLLGIGGEGAPSEGEGSTPEVFLEFLRESGVSS